MLEGEFTMEKWDQLTMVLKEYELMDLLNNIYLNLEQAEELSKDAKTIILSTAMKWQENNSNQ